VFQPPRCPYSECRQHSDPEPDFFVRHGFYHPKCRPWPVPRFRCTSCRRTFSRQTFRMDYRDHRPDLNAKLFDLLTSGVGLRQSARVLGLTRSCTVLKARKAMKALAQGQTLEVLATDPGSVADFKAFCDSQGHRLVESDEAGGTFRYLIEKG